MYFFWTKVDHRISAIRTFHCLSEVIQIPRVIFETRSQFLFFSGVTFFPSKGIGEGIEGGGALPPIQRVLLPRHIGNSLSVYLFFKFEP